MVRIKFVPFDENMRPISRATARKFTKKANISSDMSEAEDSSKTSIDEEETQVIDADDDETAAENHTSIQASIQDLIEGEGEAVSLAGIQTNHIVKLNIPGTTLKTRNVKENPRESGSSMESPNKTSTPLNSNADEEISSNEEVEDSPINGKKTTRVQRSRSGRVLKSVKTPDKSKDDDDANEEETSESESEKTPLPKMSRSGRIIKPAKIALQETTPNPETDPDSGKVEEKSQPVRSRTRRFTKAGQDIEDHENASHKNDTPKGNKTPTPAPKTSRSGRILKPTKPDDKSSSEDEDESTVPQTSRSGRSIKTVKPFQLEAKNGNSRRKRSSSSEWTNRSSRNRNNRGRSSRTRGRSSSSSEERDVSYTNRKVQKSNLKRRSTARNAKEGKKRYFSSEEEDSPLAKRNKPDTTKSRLGRNTKQSSGSKDKDKHAENEDSDDSSVEEVPLPKRVTRTKDDRKVQNSKEKSDSENESDQDEDEATTEEEEIPLSRRRTPRKVQESGRNTRLTRNSRQLAKSVEEIYTDEESEEENDRTTKRKKSDKPSSSQNVNNQRSVSIITNQPRPSRGSEKALSKAPHTARKFPNVHPGYYVTPTKTPIRTATTVETNGTQSSTAGNITIDQDEEYIDLKKLHLTKQIELMDHEIYLRKLEALKREQELTLHPSVFTADLAGACNVN